MYFTNCIKHIYNVRLMDAFAYFSDGHVSVHLSMLWKLVLKRLDTCFETSNTSQQRVFFCCCCEKSTGQIGEQLNTFWLSWFTFTQQFWRPHLVFWENVMVLSFYRQRLWANVCYSCSLRGPEAGHLWKKFHPGPLERNPQPRSVWQLHHR